MQPVLSAKKAEHLDCLTRPYSRVSEFMSFLFPLGFDNSQLTVIQDVVEKIYLFFESEEHSQHKKSVLARLSEIVKDWSY